jgi:hypothetical protein
VEKIVAQCCEKPINLTLHCHGAVLLATCTPVAHIYMYMLGALHQIGICDKHYQFCFSCFTYLFYMVFNPFLIPVFQGNRRSAGFTNEERESFGTNFLSKGFVDTFRKQHPNVVAYSYWGYRHNARKTNKGMYWMIY